MNVYELEPLERRIKDIDKLLAANAARIAKAIPNSYQMQELKSERSELSRQRYIADAQLVDLNAWIKKNYRLFQRREAEPTSRDIALEMLIEDEIDKIERQAARMEDQGDHSQARIWRLELLTVRQRTARMNGYA